MTMLFEIALIVIPMFVLLAVMGEEMPLKVARFMMKLSFVFLIIELFISWLCVFKFIEMPDLQMSIFIGTNWWNLAAGPLVFLLYVYVFTEITIAKPRNKEPDNSQEPS